MLKLKILYFVYFWSRRCIPAETEPILNSSSCYPLVNFSRPYCENHGVTLPKYVYMPPHNQTVANYYSNKDQDAIVTIGMRRISSYFHLDVATVKWCHRVFVLIRCHFFFPSCDRTQNVYERQKICRETCLTARQTCYKLWNTFRIAVELKHPGLKIKEFFQCELQPYRNAGDSPECWYNDCTKSTGNIYV